MSEINLELPTFELRNAAFRIYGETTETRELKLKELREKVLEMPNFIDIDTSDVNLLRYLRGKKFNIEKTLKTIENVIQFNHEHPTWTHNLTQNEFIVFNSVVKILNIRDKENRVIVFFKASEFIKHFTTEFIETNPRAMIRFNVFLINKLSHNSDIQIYGMIMIGSFSDFTFWDSAKLATIAPVNERLGFFKYISKCCAIRIGELLNCD